jgi:leucyl-tRNA synthetase
MRKTGHVGLDEPFAALFTQGMVTHASFRAADGRWLSPDEVELRGDGSAVEKAGGGAVQVGRIEKMSKSKRNTVDPGEIIDRYGADTARWFILSDNPPDRDMEWTEAGVVGAFRFIQRLFRLVEGAPAKPDGMPGEWSAPARANWSSPTRPRSTFSWGWGRRWGCTAAATRCWMPSCAKASLRMSLSRISRMCRVTNAM